MARPRKPGNKDLAENLYPLSGGYFRYIRPDNKKVVLMGRDRLEANRAAKRLNEKLTPEVDLVNKTLSPGEREKPFSAHLDWIEKFWQEAVDAGKMSEKTLTGYKHLVKHIREALGHLITRNIGLADLSIFLNEKTPRMQNSYRTVLIIIFTYAISEGLTGFNVAQARMKNKNVKKVRQKLILEVYRAIHKISKSYIQNGMDLGLQILARIEDIVRLNDENIKIIEGKKTLTFTPLKGILDDDPVTIEIDVGPELDVILANCQKKNINSSKVVKLKASSWLVPYPETMPLNKRRLIGQPVSTDHLSKSFTKARNQVFAEHPELFFVREKTGKIRPMTKKELPTYHEIRGLGSFLYEKALLSAGLTKDATKEKIKALTGHKTDKMYVLYTSGHEVKVSKATAGLSLGGV